MKDINMNALSGILLQRVLSALGSTEILIGNFGDVIAINKIYMLKAQREYGKAEAYLDILKIVSEETYQSIVNSEMYTKVEKLFLETENQLGRY